MPTLELKPNHKLVQSYYAALAQFDQHRVTRETAVRYAFQGRLLDHCGHALPALLLRCAMNG